MMNRRGWKAVLKGLWRGCGVFVVAVLLTVWSPVLAAEADEGETSRVSVDSAGNQADEDSVCAVISGDGRYVAFLSYASNLVVGDSNEAADVFVHDRLSGGTTRVSVDSDGNQGNGRAACPAISADGRYVAFSSSSSNLVLGDSNEAGDVFVYDRLSGETERISVDSDGNQGNGGSGAPVISAHGRYVSFSSSASNLVPGDSNGVGDVFVHDRQTGETTIVSVDSEGNQASQRSSYSAISGDGRFVAFWSAASNLAAGDSDEGSDVFVHDRATGETKMVSIDSQIMEAWPGTNFGDRTELGSWDPAISADGQHVAFTTGDASAPGLDPPYAVLVYDTQAEDTTLISVDSDGEPVGYWSRFPDVSADGRFVAFTRVEDGPASTVFVRDRRDGKTTQVTPGVYDVYKDDGRYEEPDISADGRYVAFDSYLEDLVSGDSNGVRDVFVHQLLADPPSAGSGDEMFFYRDDGLYRYYDVGPDGRIGAPIRAGVDYTAGWSSITAIDLDGDGQDEMFFYRDDGLYRYYHVNADGTIGSPIRAGDDYTPGWSVITAVDLDGDGTDEMLFYRDDGLYRYYDVAPNATLGSPIRAGNTYTPGWSSITSFDVVGNGQDRLLFYRDDGLYRYYEMLNDARIIRFAQGDDFTTGWSSITAVDLDGDFKDELFFYRDDGLYRYYNARVTNTPGITLGSPIRSGDDYTTGWSAITAVNLDNR